MPESQEAALAHHHLTALQSDLGLWDEARQQARISLRLADSNEDLGPNLRASLYDVVGRVQDCSGDAARALITFRKAQAIRNDALEPQSVDVALSHNNVAAALSSLTRWDEAGREYAQALRIVEILGGPESPETGVVIGNLGTCYRWQGRFDEAIDHYRRALPMLQSGKGEYRRRLGPLLHDLGEAHYLRGEFDEALARFREARSEYEEVLGSDHDRVAAALTAIGNCFVALRDHARALPHYERALALRAAPSTAPGPLGESRFGLAIALFYSGTDRSRALRLAAEALEDFRRAGPLGEGNLTQVREWLAQQQGDDLTLN
ncbi:MAG: hypothetical protein DRI90_26445 [Deltaproteobacteria bacterium]|nr:MAG: hypothetical protein DRI90_26445 [Deltaproteobacteria bacterium]